MLFEKCGLEIPENNWPKRVPTFASLKEACEAGVKAEIENAALYDKLFPMVEHQDIIETFQRLRDASQNNHLPAFQRCAR